MFAKPRHSIVVIPYYHRHMNRTDRLYALMASAPKDAASKLVSQIRVVQGPGGPVNSLSDVIQRALIDSVAVKLWP